MFHCGHCAEDGCCVFLQLDKLNFKAKGRLFRSPKVLLRRDEEAFHRRSMLVVLRAMPLKRVLCFQRTGCVADCMHVRTRHRTPVSLFPWAGCSRNLHTSLCTIVCTMKPASMMKRVIRKQKSASTQRATKSGIWVAFNLPAEAQQGSHAVHQCLDDSPRLGFCFAVPRLPCFCFGTALSTLLLKFELTLALH